MVVVVAFGMGDFDLICCPLLLRAVLFFLFQCLGSARRNLQLLQIRRKRGQSLASSLQIALAIRGALYWRMRRYARSAVTPCSSPPGTIRTVNREGWGPPLREGKFLPASDFESERRMSLESVLAFWERVSISVRSNDLRGIAPSRDSGPL